MTWTLGIDSSSAELGIALFQDTEQVCCFSRNLPNSHAEHISQSIRFLLETAGIKPSSIARIGIAVGPGSFTGLRIGIAFVKGLDLRGTIRILPVSSLESVAMGWPVYGNCIVSTVFDARRDKVFWGRFERSDGHVNRLSDDRIGSIEECCAALGENDIIVADTLGYSRSTVFSRLESSARFYSLDRHVIHRGAACARIAATEPENSDRWTTAMDVIPHYLRLSTPEEKLSGRS